MPSLNIGHVTLTMITLTAILVPYFTVQFIWRSDACRTPLPDLQMSCRELTTWQGNEGAIIQLSAVITQSNLSGYYTKYCDQFITILNAALWYSSRTWIRLETHNRHPIPRLGCLLWRYWRKLTALNYGHMCSCGQILQQRTGWSHKAVATATFLRKHIV